MKSLSKKVIVKIDKPYEDEVNAGGAKIYFDPKFNPTHNARIFGTIVSEGREPFQTGDRVYFHYNVVEDSLIDNDLYNVDIQRIFCIVRDEEIIMVNDWAFVEPINEHNEVVMVGNKKVEGRVENGLVVGIGGKRVADRARVKHISNNEIGVSREDEVFLQPYWEFMNTIEGKEYGTVKIDDIIAKA